MFRSSKPWASLVCLIILRFINYWALEIQSCYSSVAMRKHMVGSLDQTFIGGSCRPHNVARSGAESYLPQSSGDNYISLLEERIIFHLLKDLGCLLM